MVVGGEGGHGGQKHSNGQRVLMLPVYPPVMDLFVPPPPPNPHRCLIGILECVCVCVGGCVFHSLFANPAIYFD